MNPKLGTRVFIGIALLAMLVGCERISDSELCARKNMILTGTNGDQPICSVPPLNQSVRHPMAEAYCQNEWNRANASRGFVVGGWRLFETDAQFVAFTGKTFQRYLSCMEFAK